MGHAKVKGASVGGARWLTPSLMLCPPQGTRDRDSVSAQLSLHPTLIAIQMSFLFLLFNFSSRTHH